MNTIELAEVRMLLDNAGAVDFTINIVKRDGKSFSLAAKDSAMGYAFWHIPPDGDGPSGWVVPDDGGGLVMSLMHAGWTLSPPQKGDTVVVHPTPTAAVAAWLEQRS